MIKDFITQYTPYFEEIRKKILFSAVFFIAVFGVSFFASGYILKLFLGFFEMENVQMMVVSPFQFVGLAVNIGLFVAVIITFPLIIYSVFSFLKSALTKRSAEFLYPLFLLAYCFSVSDSLLDSILCTMP